NQSANARRLEHDTSPFAFTVPAVAYNQLHFFATAGSGPASFQVQANYADGSTSLSPVYNVPDWFWSVTQSSSAYYLTNGLGRIAPNGTVYDSGHPNSFNIFGFEYNPDPSKVLESITIQPISETGTFVFFGATGLTDATYLGSSGQAITGAEGQA